MAAVEVFVPWLYKKPGMLKNAAAADQAYIK